MIMYFKMINLSAAVCGLLRSTEFTAAFAYLLAVSSFSCLFFCSYLPQTNETANNSPTKPFVIILSFTDTFSSWPWATMSKIILEHWYKLLRTFFEVGAQLLLSWWAVLEWGRVLLCLRNDTILMSLLSAYR